MSHCLFSDQLVTHKDTWAEFNVSLRKVQECQTLARVAQILHDYFHPVMKLLVNLQSCYLYIISVCTCNAIYYFIQLVLKTVIEFPLLDD